MEIHTTATFDELFLKLPRKIQTKADEKTKLFRENPFNPVLRTEKKSSILRDMMSGASELICSIGLYSNSQAKI